MTRKCIFLSVILGLLSTATARALAAMLVDSTNDETYYIGINPVAPFTSIRNETASRRLPILSNLETGLAVFGGKTWNRHYNLETRFSYGSPMKGYRMLLVQSSFHYCFDTKNRRLHTYAGLFVKYLRLRRGN